jgi:enterochelin esterase-like enzyme
MYYAKRWRRMVLAIGVVLLAVIGQQGLAADAAPAGALEKVTVHSPSLEGNLSGDSADRAVFIYLPAGYAKEKKRRYPVVYFLHGFAATAERYVEFLSLPGPIDRAVAAGKLAEAIYVLPDTMNRFGGSMYSSSPTIGDWEGFIARDLVGYVDSHYRTLARRESRGLAGHSMGGYATLRIGMKNPDVFGALYSMSACCTDPRKAAPNDADMEKIMTLEQVEKMTPFARTTLAVSASWAANIAKPPLYLDLPTQGGQVQQDVLDRYTANAPSVMVSQYASQLKRYKAIAMDIGLQDSLIAGNAATDTQLTRLGVPHSYSTYEGDHMNKVAARFEQFVVPFFAQHLDAGPGKR